MDLLLTRARLTGLLVTVLATWMLAADARADIFSPGELSKAHAKLEGLRNCTACHPAGGELSPDTCLDCHKELQGRVRKGDGYHGRMAPAERGRCERCHREHEGRDFKLIQWVPSKAAFPHRDTGWALTGKHAEVKCDACHDPRLITAADVRALLAERPSRETYLGLPTRCAACHFDEHRGQLGTKCEQCHTTAGWRPAPGFDHAKTDFALTGRHLQVKCSECHAPKEDTQTPATAFPAPRAKSFAVFGELPHQTCQDCHADPHQGRFGAACASCHTTAGWRSVKAGGGKPGFHDKTRFPLEGLHASVACRACHGPFKGQKAKFRGLAFAQCTDCHLDAHLGQLTVAGKKPQPCEACHSVEGFVPAKFELEDHGTTGYALEGAHRAAACNGCHRDEPSLRKKVPAASEKLLARQARPVRVSLWLFDLGAKADRCDGCHADPHQGQFGRGPRPRACVDCHKVTSFSDVAFDHARDAAFPLEGKHAEIACRSCHEKLYRGVPRDCAGCHTDVHAGQFAANGKPAACDPCHSTTAFVPARFTHAEPFTAFTLDGKHAQVPCARCHPAIAVAAGVTATRYRGVPKDCEGCHADFHQGAFSGFQP